MRFASASFATGWRRSDANKAKRFECQAYICLYLWSFEVFGRALRIDRPERIRTNEEQERKFQMTFNDEEMDLVVVGKARRVRVTGEALHVLWGADTGPQDGAGMLAAHVDLIRTIALLKLTDSEPSDEIAITGLDIEG